MLRMVRIFFTICLVFAFVMLTGCFASDPKITIMVGASSTPHAEILRAAKPILEKEGYMLDIIEFNDYIQPNIAVATEELDANFFQHVMYLDEFNEQQGTSLAVAAVVHFEPFGLYAGKTSSLDALLEGSTIALPNDTTNEGRALALLEQAGLIKLQEGVGLEATVLDIVENPRNLNFQEVEAAQLPLALHDVDIAAINGNYALGAGLTPQDALILESDEGVAAKVYANVLAVLPGHVEDAKIRALVQALQSSEVHKFIEETYQGAVVPLF